MSATSAIRVPLSTIMRPALAASVALGCFALIPASPAYGCSCAAAETVTEALGHATAVFTGTVSDIRAEGTSSRWLTVALTAEETWKGVEPGLVTIRTATAEASCGFSFEDGRRYLVYASAEGQGTLSVSFCSRTALASQATADLEVLGPGRTLRDVELDGPGTNRPHAFPKREAIVAGVLVVVILSLGGAFLLWRMDNDPDTLDR
ncbi:MAG: hypothetical protein ACE5EF_00400 [Dehalococcoidia bacterium]